MTAARPVGVAALAIFKQALRMTWRDARAGELNLLLVALVLAVAALTSVGFLADRMRQALVLEAHEMIGADFVVRADHPLDTGFAADAAQLGLSTTRTAVFPSMVGGPHAAAVHRLAALKAVAPGYPLRGQLQVTPAPGITLAAQAIPAPGTVWLEASLLAALHLHLGDTLQVGQRNFKIAALIEHEPDRGFAFVNFYPRVMLNQADLASTGLIGFGSRVTYRLLVAGERARVAQFAQAAQARLAEPRLRGVALESSETGQPEVRQALERARRFLALVALLTGVLAAISIALATQRYMLRHLDSCAVLRCLGLSRARLTSLFVLEFSLLGLAGGLLGCAFGYVGHLLLGRALHGLLGLNLPAASWQPAGLGLLLALVLLLGFAVPPLLRLAQVPPLHALRRTWGPAPRLTGLAYTGGVLLFGGLLVAEAGELRLGLLVAGGFALALLVFIAVARLLVQGLARWAAAGHGGFAWRHALASLDRRGLGAALQIAGLALGLTGLLLVVITRNDLIAGWRAAMPADAPNQFVLDIQPDQREPVRDYLAHHGISDVALAPMVRGRLIAYDDVPAELLAQRSEGARHLVEREFNLSYTEQLPADNRLSVGTWFGASTQPQISLEAGVAKTLGLRVGQRLRFDIMGVELEAPITSLRQLDWNTFRVNFFILMPPAVLRDFPVTYITSFHLGAGQQSVLDGLSAQYPGLTVLDVGPLLAQMQRMLLQVVDAVQGLFGLTLAAGVLVLYTALVATREARLRDIAVCRALGASRAQISTLLGVEALLSGALAGILAAAGAAVLGALLARQVFAFTLSVDPWLWPAGIVAGIVGSSLASAWNARRILAQPALTALRSA